MDWFAIIIFGFIASVALPVVYRLYQYKNLTAAFLGAPIKQTHGEIILSSTTFTSQTLKVHTLGPAADGQTGVAIEITAKAPLGFHVMPIKLTRQQAQQLSSLLQSASQDW